MDNHSAAVEEGEIVKMSSDSDSSGGEERRSRMEQGQGYHRGHEAHNNNRSKKSYHEKRSSSPRRSSKDYYWREESKERYHRSRSRSRDRDDGSRRDSRRKISPSEQDYRHHHHHRHRSGYSRKHEYEDRRAREWESSGSSQRYEREQSSRESTSRNHQERERGGIRNYERRKDPGESRRETRVPIVPMPPAVNPATKLLEEIQLRKLIFSKKTETPASSEQSTSTWKQSTFTADSDGKMSEKFRRLMGMKNVTDQDQDISTPSTTSSALGSEARQKQQKCLVDLEKQYEVARVTTLSKRGLGFE